MIPIKTDLKTWPRRNNGEPIFRTDNDAIFYAQLAYKRIETVDEMKAYREKAHRDLQHVRKTKNPNLDRLMKYAFKAQTFRTCFMEILRIRDEEKRD